MRGTNIATHFLSANLHILDFFSNFAHEIVQKGETLWIQKNKHHKQAIEV